MRRAVVIHPFFFAMYPVLFLFVENMDEFHPNVVVIPIILTTGLVFLSWCALGLIIRDWQKAGLIVSLFCLLLFSFGPILDSTIGFIKALDVMSDLLVRLGVTARMIRTSILLAEALLFAVVSYFVTRTRRYLRNATIIANVTASALVAISIVRIGAYQITQGPGSWNRASLPGMQASEVNWREPNTLPSIYYIILDGYARADILEEIYQYDNSDFLDYLVGKGFYVAERSRSNYCQTALSLGASMNLEYLDSLLPLAGTDSQYRRAAYNLVTRSTVSAFLRDHGYTTVVFSSGWSPTDIRSADVYMAARWYPDDFQIELMEMTPVGFSVRMLGYDDQYDMQREQILYALWHLADISSLEAPVFVFAHIVAPHPPFVFGQHGEEVEPDYRYTIHDGSHIIKQGRLTGDEYVDGYRDQLVFINNRLRSAIDAILSNPTEPPIIILQSDHGPGSLLDWEDPAQTYSKERLSILSAYYFPGSDYTDLYDDITPVNTFRLLFNKHFGTDLELLADKSYFSTWSRPYEFIDVTDEVTAGLDTGRPE